MYGIDRHQIFRTGPDQSMEMIGLIFFFRSLKVRCHSNQFCGKMGEIGRSQPPFVALAFRPDWIVATPSIDALTAARIRLYRLDVW